MFNIIFKGKYKDEKQLIENSKLQKNSVMFKEESNVTQAFISGLKFAIPISAIIIILFLIIVKLNNLKLQYSVLHFGISSVLIMPLMYIHEFIHALTYPIKSIKYIYSKPEEMALFVYCNAVVSKIRFVFICLMPTILLTIIPSIFAMVFINSINIQFSIDIIYIAIAMCIGALGDFTNVYNTLKQVPKHSRVFNYGYHSYWIKNTSQD